MNITNLISLSASNSNFLSSATEKKENVSSLPSSQMEPVSPLETESVTHKKHYDINQILKDPVQIDAGKKWIEQFEDQIGNELLDQKQFAHIHADSYAGKTSLEGNQFAQTLSHFQHHVKNCSFKELNSDQELQFLLADAQLIAFDILEQRKKSAPSESESDYSDDESGFLSDLSKTLQAFKKELIKKTNDQVSIEDNRLFVKKKTDDLFEKLQQLAIGKVKLVPGGYTDASKGHALLYEFKKTRKNGKDYLQLRIFNTGEGLDYYYAKSKEGKTKYSSFLVYQNIELNADFKQSLQALIECLVPEYEALQKSVTAIEYVLGKIIPLFKGELVPALSQSEDTITHQLAGFCTERVLHAYLRQYLIEKYQLTPGVRLYKLFIEEYKFKTLVLYYKKNKDTFNASEADQSLMLNSLTLYQESLTKFIPGRSLSSEILSHRLAALAYLSTEMKKWRTPIFKEVKENPDWSLVLYPPALKVVENSEDITDPLFCEILNTTASPKPDVSYRSYPFNSLKEIVDIHELRQEIQSLLAFISNVQEAAPALQAYELFFSRLPIPSLSHAKNLWKLSLSQSDYENLLTDFDAISQAMFLYQCMQNSNLTLSQLLASHKHLAIMDYLARQDSRNHLAEVGIEFLDLDRECAYLIFREAKQNTEWIHLQAYFEQPAFKIKLSYSNMWVAESDLNHPNHQLSYFKRFLPKFFEPKKSAIEKSLMALTDLEGKIIPKGLSLLRRHQLKNYFLYIMFGEFQSSLKKEKGLDLVLKYEKSTHERWIFKIYSSLDEWIYYSQFKPSEDRMSATFPHLDKALKACLKDRGALKEPNPNPYRQDQEIKVREYEKDLISSPISGSSFEKTRDLRLLFLHFNSKNYPHLAFRALNYFQEHAALLAEAGEREFLEAILSIPGCIQQGLVQDPKLANALMRFATEGYAKAWHKNLRQGLFFLKLKSRFAYFIQALDIPNSAIQSKQEELVQLLSQVKTLEERSLICWHLLDSFIGQDIYGLPSSELEKVAAYAFMANLNPDCESNPDDHWGREQVLTILSHVIRQLFNQDSDLIQRIGRQVLQLMEYQSTTDIWRQSSQNPWIYQLNTEADHQLELNFIRFELFDSQSSLLPTYVKNHYKFKDFINNRPYTACTLSKGSFLIQIDNQADPTIPLRVIVTTQKEKLKFSIHHPFGTEYAQLKGIGSYYGYDINWLADHQKKNYLFWVDDQQKVFITDFDGQLQYYQEKDDQKKQPVFVKSRYQESEGKIHQDLKRVTTQDAYYSKWFKTFETNGSKKINIWKTQDTQGCLGVLDLCEFDLQFELRADQDGKIQAFCVGYPSYFLDFTKSWHGLGAFTHYLILRHQEDPKRLKVCLRFSAMMIEDFAKITLHKYSILKEKRSFFILDLNEQGQPIGVAVEHHLYLMYLYLIQAQDPKYLQLAYQELQSIWQLEPYEKQAENIFSWLFDLDFYSLGSPLKKDPGVASILLKAAVTLEKNLEGRGLAYPQFYPKSISINYKFYVKVIIELLTIYHTKPPVNQDYILSIGDLKTLAAIIQRATYLPTTLLCAIQSKETSFKAYTSFKRIKKVDQAIQSKVLNSDVFDVRYANDPEGLAALVHQSSFFAKYFCSSLPVPEEIMNQMSQLPMIYLTQEELIKYFPILLRWALGPDKDKRQELWQRLLLMHMSNENRDIVQILVLAIHLSKGFFNKNSLVKFFNQIFFGEFYLPKTLLDEDQLAKFFKKIFPKDAKINHNFTELSANSWHSNQNSNLAQYFKQKIETQAQALLSQEPLQMASIEYPSVVKPDAVQPIYLHTVNANDQVWIDEINQEIQAYYEQPIPSFKVKDRQTILAKLGSSELPGTYKQKFQQMTGCLKQSEQEILERANKLPDDPKLNLIVRIKRSICQEKQAKKVDDLLICFANGSTAAWQKWNRHLSAQDVQGLNQQILAYLEQATALQLMAKKLNLMTKISLLTEGSEKEKALRQKLSELEETRRAFDTNLHLPSGVSSDQARVFMVFEYLSNLFLKPKQVQLIKDFMNGINNPNAKEFIAQLIMGAGKSTVILPLLVFLVANSGKVPFVVIPHELLNTQQRDLNGLTQKLFGQKGRTFHFTADARPTQYQLTQIKDLLWQAKQDREYIVVDPETLQALKVKFREMRKMLEGQTESEEDKVIIRLLAEILQFIEEDSVLLLEEADTVLSPKRELNLASGVPEKIPLDQCELVGHLYQQILSHGSINLADPDNGIAVSRQYPNIQDDLAHHFAAFLISNAQGPIAAGREKELAQYLKGVQEDIPSWIEQAFPSKASLNQIGMIRGQLKTYLKLTLSKSGFKDYALSKNENVVYVIPARLCQPCEGSQFGTAEEAINYTLQHLLQVGIPKQHLSKAIQDLQKQYEQDQQMGFLDEKSSAYKSFKELFPNEDLQQANQEQIPDLLYKLNDDPSLIILFTCRYLLTQIEIYPYKFSSNAHDLISISKRVFGFTGMPWNHRAWPQRLACHHDRGTDGELIALTRKKSQELEDPIRFIDTPSPEGLQSIQEFINTCVKNLLDPFKEDQPIYAVIDTGALLKGMQPEMIGKAFWNYFKLNPELKFKGIRLFVNNEAMILKPDGSLSSAWQCTIPRQEIFTFYDNAHFIGANFKLPGKAKGVCTLSTDLLYKDFMQGSLRLRKLAKQQNLYYVGLKECQTYMQAILHKESEAKFEIDDILTFTALVQAKPQVDEVYRSARAQIVASVLALVDQALIKADAAGNFEQATHLFQAFDALEIFATDQRFSPWEQHGQPSYLEEPLKVLEDLRERWVQKLIILSNESHDPLVKKVALQAREEVEELKLPTAQFMLKKVQAKEVDRMEREVQQQVQKHVEQEEHMNVSSSNFVCFKPYNCLRPRSEVDLKTPLCFKFLSLNNVFSQKKIPDSHAFFDSHLYISINQIPNLGSNADLSFTKYQPPFNHMLIEQTGRSDQPFNYYMLCESDYEIYLEELKNYNTSYFKQLSAKFKRPPLLWVYTIASDHSQQETEAGLVQNWKTQANVKQIIVQAKILNGQIAYYEDELNELYRFIRKMGSSAFEEFFKKVGGARESYAFYAHSILAKMVKKAEADERFGIAIEQGLPVKEQKAFKAVPISSAKPGIWASANRIAGWACGFFRSLIDRFKLWRQHLF